jgi:hypothetical protein
MIHDNSLFEIVKISRKYHKAPTSLIREYLEKTNNAD